MKLAALAVSTAAWAIRPTRPGGNFEFADPFVGTGADGHTFPGATYPFGMVQLSPTSDVWDWSHCSGYHYDDKSVRCFSHVNLSGTGWTDTGDVGVFPARADFSLVSTGAEDPNFPAVPGNMGDCSSDGGSWQCASPCQVSSQAATHVADEIAALRRLGHNDTMAEAIWSTTAPSRRTATMCQGWRSEFSHDEEEAWPGYYAVNLKTHDVYAELTALPRSGVHRYTFGPKVGGMSPMVVLDLTNRLFPHANIVTATAITWISDTEIGGHAHCGYNCWRYNYLTPHLPREGKTHFYVKFSQPVQAVYSTPTDKSAFEFKVERHLGLAEGDEIVSLCPYGGPTRCKTFFLQLDDGVSELTMTVGISHTSVANAKMNLEADISTLSFDDAYEKSIAGWTSKLDKIQVKAGGTPDAKRVFYSGLYHTYIHPNLATDVSGQFVSFDRKYKTADVATEMNIADFTNYSTFSTWDTFRALHPLHSILEPEASSDWVNSIVSRYFTGNYIALWELMGGDTITQIGYPSVPVVVNAILRGVDNVDADSVFEAVSHIAHYNVDSSSDGPGGLDSYLSRGYVAGETSKSVSKTLEYAFEDYCIAELARYLGRPEEDYYRTRSLNYRNLFDPSRRQFWPKDKDGEFFPDFDVHDWANLNQHWIAGNMWGYNYFVAQDMPGLIQLHGGEAAFEADLDRFFSTDPAMGGDEHVDISGWIGSYAHGEESSHSNAYLYNFVRQGGKAQALVRKVLDEFYLPQPAGLINNEDCGQMSAWMIWASLGLFPYDSCSNTLTVGAPVFDSVDVRLGNGKVLSISTEADADVARSDLFVTGLLLNGKDIDPLFVDWTDLKAGGSLTFRLSADYVSPSPAPASTSEGHSDGNDMSWVWILVAAAALAVITVIVVMCLRRRAAKNAEEDSEESCATSSH